MKVSAENSSLVFFCVISQTFTWASRKKSKNVLFRCVPHNLTTPVADCTSTERDDWSKYYLISHKRLLEDWQDGFARSDENVNPAAWQGKIGHKLSSASELIRSSAKVKYCGREEREKKTVSSSMPTFTCFIHHNKMEGLIRAVRGWAHGNGKDWISC